jgi:hypothetical protein
MNNKIISFGLLPTIQEYNELDNMLVNNQIRFKTFYYSDYKKLIINSDAYELVILLPLMKQNQKFNIRKYVVKIRLNYTDNDITRLEATKISFTINNNKISVCADVNNSYSNELTFFYKNINHE